MTRKVRNTIIIILVVLVFAALGLFSYFSKRVTMNPVGTIGNNAGNLNNSGLFCEYDGTVYFANTYDGNSLYAMDTSEGNLRKLNSVSVCNILAGGNYLYYFQTKTSGAAGFGAIRNVHSFNRCNLKGKDAKSLSLDVVISAQLVDNYIYFLTTDANGPSFSKVKIDGSEKTLLADYEINPACAVNGSIYYNGTRDNHYLYQLNTSTDTSTEVWQGNLWYPIVNGDYVYYMDVANNYRLCRYSLSQNVIEVLTDDRIDCFNVNYGYVYYQKNGDSPQLKCMREDGSNAFVLAEGNFTNINITSQYVYFQEFGNDTVLYHSYLGGTGYDVFAGARDAALTAK